MARKPVATRPKVQLITSPAVWRTMIAPARVEIIEAMRCAAPCGIAEIGELLGRPADGLYRHIRLLMQAGIVREVGFRKVGRRTEQVFDLTASDYRIAFADSTGAAERTAIAETVSVFARSVSRYAGKAAAARALVLEPEKQNLLIDYDLTWLEPDAVKQLRTLVGRIHELCERGRRRRKGELYVNLCTLMPVVRSRRGKTGAGAGTGAGAADAGPAKAAPKRTRKRASAASAAPADSPGSPTSSPSSV